MINHLYRLKYIIRYSNYKRITNEDVAQHSFYVSSLCILLHQDYPKADLGRMLMMSTIHDWPETDVDDVSHKIKMDYPTIAKGLKRAEKVAIKQYPKEVQEAYHEYEEQKTLEAQLVKYADTLQCVQYLEAEVEMGNNSLVDLLEHSRKRYYNMESEIKEAYYGRTPQLPLGDEDAN